MPKWLRRIIGFSRSTGRSYETLSTPYPPLLAELDALSGHPICLVDRETRATRFYIDTVERTFTRYGSDMRARTFVVDAATNENAVVLKGRTNTDRSWMVMITRAEPDESIAVDYCACVRVGECHYGGLLVCPSVNGKPVPLPDQRPNL